MFWAKAAPAQSRTSAGAATAREAIPMESLSFPQEPTAAPRAEQRCGAALGEEVSRDAGRFHRRARQARAKLLRRELQLTSAPRRYHAACPSCRISRCMWMR